MKMCSFRVPKTYQHHTIYKNTITFVKLYKEQSFLGTHSFKFEKAGDKLKREPRNKYVI